MLTVANMSTVRRLAHLISIIFSIPWIGDRSNLGRVL